MLVEKVQDDNNEEKDSAKVFELDLKRMNWFRALVYESWKESDEQELDMDSAGPACPDGREVGGKTLGKSKNVKGENSVVNYFYKLQLLLKELSKFIIGCRFP